MLLNPVMLTFQFIDSFLDLKLAKPLAVDFTFGISFFPDSFALYFSFAPFTSDEPTAPITIKDAKAIPITTREKYLIIEINIAAFISFVDRYLYRKFQLLVNQICK